MNAIAGTLSVVADDTSSYGSITGGTVTVGAGATLFAQSFLQDPNGSSFEINSVVKLSGTTSIASDTDLQLYGGGSLGGVFTGAGELSLEGHVFSSTTPTFTSTVASLASENFDVSGATLIMAAGSSGTMSGNDGASSGGTIIFLGNSTVTLSGTMAVSYDANLLLGAGDKLTLSNDLLLDNSGQVYVAPNASLTVSGALEAGLGTLLDNEYDTTIYGGGTLATSGTMVVAYPGDGIDELFLGKGLTWVNSGTSRLFGDVAMNVVSTDTLAIVNQAAGVIDLENENANILDHYTDGTDTLSNAGTLGRGLDASYYGSDSGTSSIAAIVRSTGLIDVEQGTLAFTDGGTISGTLSGAGTLLLYSGSYTLGTLGGNGHLDVASGASIVYVGSPNIAGTVLLDGGETLTIAAGQTTSYTGTLDIGDVSGGAAIDGPGTLSTPGITNIFDGGTNVLELALNGGLVWKNAGTVSDGGFGYAAYPGGTGVSIINSGTFDFTSDDATLTVFDTSTANTLTNPGTLAKTGGAGTSLLGLAINSTGAIAVASGTLAMTAGGLVAGSLAGAGLLDLGGGAFTSTGLSGAGHLAVTGGATLTETASGTIATSVRVSNTATVAVSPKAGVLTLPGQVTFGDASGYGALSGPGTLSTTGTTTIADGGANVLEFVIDGGVTWKNAGTVNDGGFGYAAYPGGTGASIANSGTFNLTSDDATLTVYDTSTANTWTNTGTLAKTGGTGTSLIGLAVRDTGAIAVASGTLVLAAGGLVSGALSGAGVLDLAAGTFTTTGLSGGGDLAITGGVHLTETATGTIAASLLDTGNATLLVSPKAAVLTLAGSVMLGDASGFGAFSGPGTISTTGTTAIFDGGPNVLAFASNGGVTWANAGTVNDGGFGYVAYGSGAGNTTITNSGTFNLTSDDATLTVYDSSTPSVFTSSGTLAKTAGTGTSLLGMVVNSSGVITVASGTLALANGGMLSGSLSGAGQLALAAGAFTTTGLSGAGHLALSGASSLTETAAGTIAAAVSVTGNATLLVSPAAAILTLPGQVTLGGASGYGGFYGPGTIATTGTTAILDGGANVLAFVAGGGLTWANSGTVNDGGFGYFAYPSSAGGAAITNGGTFNLTSDDTTLTIYDSSFATGFTNSGTLAKTGGTGTSFVGLTINNTGTIAAASGTLALGGGGTLNGAIIGAGDVALTGGIFTTAGISGAGTLLVNSSVGNGNGIGAAMLVSNVNATITESLILDGQSTIAPAVNTTLTLSGAVTLGDASGYGRLNGAGTIVTTHSVLLPDLAGADAVDIGGGITWVNSGTVSLGSLATISQTSVISNAAGGVFDFTSDDAAIAVNSGGGGTGQFNNAGLLAKTGGTQTSTIGIGLSNSGTVEVVHGTLSLAGGVTGTGILKIDAGATLDAGAIPSTEAIVFNGGAAATLKMEAPASIGTLTNFTAGDRLDLVGTSLSSAKITGTTLTLVTSSSSSFTYLSSGLASKFATTASDGNGGTFVTLYRAANPTHTPEPLVFGNFHVGSTAGTSALLTVTNTAAADGYSEKLNAGFGGASGGFSAMGSFTGLAAGGSNGAALSATIDTSAAGAKSGTATLTLASSGAGVDGRGATALTSQTVNFTGAVYAYAAAQVSNSGTVDLGVIHAGVLSMGVLGLTNGAAPGAYSEALDAGFSGASAGLLASGSIAGLLAGNSNSGSLVLGVNTAASGAYAGSTTLTLASDGTVIGDGLGITSLTGQTITVLATVDNYALAAFEDPSGPALSGTSTNATLNLGSVAQGGSALSATFGVLNAATGLSDTLVGTISTAGGTGFTNSGFGSFGGLGAGQDEHAQIVSLSTGAAGVFSETILLSSSGTNASGYNGALAAETLTITGTVIASSVSTYTLDSGPNVIVGADGLGDVFVASGGSLNSRDQLTGGNGANTLTMTGGGTFDINSLKIFSNIPTLKASEGQAASGTLANTVQTILLTDIANENLTVAAGKAATGNANAETIRIFGASSTNSIMLASGRDQVTLANGHDSITLGGAANSVSAGSGTALIRGTAAFAQAAVVGNIGAATTLEITTGGAATLNAADTYLTVHMDAAGTLKLSAMGFIAAVGSTGNDSITALGGAQTLTGGVGADTLIGYTGGNDSFADSAAGLNGDTIRNWTTGDVIDLKDISFASLHALGFSANSLTVSDGTTSCAIKFAAGQALHNFAVLGADGHGGTSIGYHT